MTRLVVCIACLAAAHSCVKVNPSSPKGNKVGNTIESVYLLQNVSWFQDSDSNNKLCVVIGEDFPLQDRHVIKKVLNDVFAIWQSYMKLKNTPLRFSQDPAHVVTYDLGKCAWKFKGKDHLTQPILFLGTPSADHAEYPFVTQEMRRLLAKEPLTNTLAFVHEGKNNAKFIWINAESQSYNYVAESWYLKRNLGESVSRSTKVDMNNPQVLKSVLIHEIGHTFGNLHIPGTIMDKLYLMYLERHVKSFKVAQSANGSYIDLHKELASCLDSCPAVTYELFVPGQTPKIHPKDLYSQENLRTQLGLKAKKIERIQVHVKQVAHKDVKYRLTVHGDGKTYSCQLKKTKHIMQGDLTHQSFRYFPQQAT